jgi:ribosomal protein RSM22 (predicted rRNA methylase)
VQLPEQARRVMEERAEAAGFAELKRAALEMSDAWRAGRNTAAARISGPLRAAAYLAARMPATYAAAHFVLGELRRRMDAAVTSVLDVGAGTGAASLAACQWFPEASVSMIERDAALAEAARAIVPGAAITIDDAARMPALPPHDLVIAAYSLGELGRAAVARLWAAARVALVVIEPGTPAGCALTLAVRDELLAASARVAAPCPAPIPCPLAAPDWCHFGARVERPGLLRRIKEGKLSYEDEKFSYVALTREPASPAAARILRRPLHHPGLIVLETCTPEGTRGVRATRRDPEAFRKARHSAWGDAWE